MWPCWRRCVTGSWPLGFKSPRLSLGFIVVKRHHYPLASLINENISLGLAEFRGLVHFHHGRKRGGAQADMMLEKGPRALHLHQWKKGRESGLSLSI